MKLKTMIVDDEPLARERLKFMLAADEDLEIVAECKNGNEALASLRAQPVDLLLLDVQMPGLNGFEFIRELGPANLPPTIFVTAYQEHAVQAFEIEAVDYLTKPIEHLRLKQAILRVRERTAARSALLNQAEWTAHRNQVGQAAGTAKSYLTRLPVRDGHKDILLPVDLIEWIEATDYYSSLHTKECTFLLRESMAELARKLNPALFVRVHRCTIVNLNHICAIYREGSNEGSLDLSNGCRLRFSKSGRQRLMEVIRS